MDDRRPLAPPLIVVELQKRGKLVTGEPFFTPGVPLIIEPKTLGHLKPGDLAAVRVTPGRARVEQSLGSAKRIENVLEALLLERGARMPFEPHTLPEPDFDNRVDLRQLTTFTIDPDTAKDFDDALSFRREPEGIRAWVHIADVSHFVPAGCPLDRGAAERALSTYVPGIVAPMLPHELADDACSLRPHVDRLCVTVEMPPRDGEPLFYRSVIRSDARLTYGEAQRNEASPEIQEQLALANEVASELRRRRFARGALEVQTPELNFSFAQHRPSKAWLEGEPHSHMLVEELMIRANECVAAFLASRNREALFRVHEPPEPFGIQALVAKLAALGVPTPPLPENLTSQQAAAFAGEISRAVTKYTDANGRGKEAFSSLVLRALKQARYDPQNLGHSGLASVAYCHFTSPIRRYPDLVVHRALLHELGLSDESAPSDLAALAEHASSREREAAKLEHTADDICLAWLLEDALLDVGWEHRFDGQIIGVIGSGLFVRFGEVFEGYIPARRLPGEYFELNDTGTALEGRRSGKAYPLGDSIRVKVESISRNEGKVELAPVFEGEPSRGPKPQGAGNRVKPRPGARRSRPASRRR